MARTTCPLAALLSPAPRCTAMRPTYLERDITQIAAVESLPDLRRLMRALCLRLGARPPHAIPRTSPGAVPIAEEAVVANAMEPEGRTWRRDRRVTRSRRASWSSLHGARDAVFLVAARDAAVLEVQKRLIRDGDAMGLVWCLRNSLAFGRRCIPAACVAPLSDMGQYPRSSRLASRAHRRPRCTSYFGDTTLAPGLTWMDGCGCLWSALLASTLNVDVLLFATDGEAVFLDFALSGLRSKPPRVES
jgi:hypothetical protein